MCKENSKQQFKCLDDSLKQQKLLKCLLIFYTTAEKSTQDLQSYVACQNLVPYLAWMGRENPQDEDKEHQPTKGYQVLGLVDGCDDKNCYNSTQRQQTHNTGNRTITSNFF